MGLVMGVRRLAGAAPWLVPACLGMLGAGPAGASATGAEFLRFVPSARAVGMGEASAAAGSGPDALSGNPAGLVSGPGSAVGFSHGTEIGGQRQEAVSFVTGHGSVGAGLQLVLSTMSFDAVDGVGDQVAVSAQDLVASAGVARVFGGIFRAGVLGRVWTSSLLDRRATGFTGDAGLRAVVDGRYSAGIVVQHLGSAETFGNGSAAVPGRVRAGLAARHVSGDVSFAGTVEWVAYFAGESGGPHAGAEVAWRRFSVRAGYAGSRALGRWSAGGSAGAGPLTLHYALAARDLFGPAHRISAEWRWGGGVI